MNRLQHETSPYLLQHKDNPVDWYPWGEEAINKAKELDKPILLSIGYSACHWCHVMAHESFENKQIAQIMNEYFVNIKIDREERPDVDSLYMNYVQLTTGSGGWPLTVFLTPDLIPFYGGTYFPPTERYGRPGFPRILESIASIYSTKKKEIENQSIEIINELENMNRIASAPGSLTLKHFDDAFLNIYNSYDKKSGGFGSAPKFPASMTLLFMIDYYSQTKNGLVLEAVENSLIQMARGGIYDQLAGGFHRYSTDAEWLVPHFEKMLYDNALLARPYLKTYQVTKNDFYLRIAEETLQYMMREMLHKDGGFFSAQDADSEGEEGKYFVWGYDEVKSILNAQEFNLAKEVWGITQEGNFESMNILTNKRDIKELAGEFKIAEKELLTEIEKIKRKLLSVRERRVKPGLDDKILVNWNGLAISSFAIAYGVTGKLEYLNTALNAAEFIWTECLTGDVLYRTWKNGIAKIQGFLDDYAFLIESFILLYQNTFNEKWLTRAEKLNTLMLEKFYDKSKEEFFSTEKDNNELFIRVKDIYDNAIPAGASVAVYNLLKLSFYMNNEDYKKIAVSYLEKMSSIIIKHPLSFSYLLTAGYFHVNIPNEIALIYTSENEKKKFIKELNEEYYPFLLLAGRFESESSSLEILQGKNLLENSRITIYVCRNYSCRKPVTLFSEMLELIPRLRSG